MGVPSPTASPRPYAGWTIQDGFDRSCCIPEGDCNSFRPSRYPFLSPVRVAEELEAHLALEFAGATIQVDWDDNPGPLIRNIAISPNGEEDFFEIAMHLESELELFWSIRFPQLQSEYGEFPIEIEEDFELGVAA